MYRDCATDGLALGSGGALQDWGQGKGGFSRRFGTKGAVLGG